MVIAPKEKSLFAFWRKVRFKGGERETDLLMHAPNSLLSFLVFFFFFSVFVLIFFLFLLLYFFF